MKTWHRMLAVLMLMVLAVSCAAAKEYPEGTLYRGIKGHTDEVRHLQYLLFYEGYLGDDEAEIDGVYGKKTETAVKAYQTDHGLKATGVADAQTLEWLETPEDPDGDGEEWSRPDYCNLVVLEEGMRYWENCERHMNVYTQANHSIPENASEEESANAYVVAWQTELDRLYQLWMENCASEDQLTVAQDKMNFQNELNAQRRQWEEAYSKAPAWPDPQTQTWMALEEKCYLLCSHISTLNAQEEQGGETVMEYPEGTLYRGIYGYHDEIEFLQYQLFYAGYLGDDISVVDGVFGEMTENAIKQYQKDHGIDVTGIACPNTVTALDIDWENMMEPQGGEEEYEDPYPYCYLEYHDNDSRSVVLCSRHMQLSAKAAGAVNQAQQNDEQIIEGLQTGITFWMEEINSIYQHWAALRPEYAQQITAHQEAFMDYYRAQLAVWNAHFGSPSMAALEKAMEMLADQCSYLCITLSGAI